MAHPGIGVNKLRPTEPIAWRAWAMSPQDFKGRERPVMDRGIKFMINNKLFTVGYGGVSMADLPEKWAKFRQKYNKRNAFYFAKRVEPGDLVILCRDTKTIAAWGYVSQGQHHPFFVTKKDYPKLWPEVRAIQEATKRVFADHGTPDSWEAFDNCWKIDAWHEVDSGPLTSTGCIPGSWPPTLVPFSMDDAGQWVPGLRAKKALNPDKLVLLPTETAAGGEFLEGASVMVLVERRERDPEARERCIAIHGSACAVCGLKFGQVYGSDAEGFIVVHHLNPLAAAKGERPVDPEEDLRPVCPNCHAVIHMKSPPFSIDEVRGLIQRHCP